MLVGIVRSYLPPVSLELHKRDGWHTAVEFTLDTGFDGDLTLPASIMAGLNAICLRDRVLRLTDGSLQQRAVYELLLDWDGAERFAEVHVLENPPLLGARLLDAYLVTLEMTEGGDVTIEPL